MLWTIESFTPSDGSIVCGAPVDHHAWIAGEDRDREAPRPPIHIKLQMSSKGVTPDQARRYFDAMVTGLNAAEAMPR